MSNRLALLAAVSTLVLTLTLSASSRAQQENPRPAGGEAQNPTAGQQQKNEFAAATETIRGVIAGITAEGEVMFDYRNNRAVAAEAAFLTVVGSPTKSSAAGEAIRPAAAASEERGSANRRRHNVYIVWLTPKTKICEAAPQGEKAGTQGETRNAEQKREVALDSLEVGDHVEIQFALRDDSSSTGSAHQTEQMRRKHGRNRTHVGFATAVTILPPKDAASHAEEGEGKQKGGSQ
jgi:hypothetical protein